MNSEYKELCENIWQDWRNGTLTIPKYLIDQFYLQPEFLPEPYLIFNTGKETAKSDKALYFLTTNPGNGWEGHQGREKLKASYPENEKYEKVAHDFAEKYLNEILKGPAKRRVEGFIHLAETLGYNQLIQVESLPFHSKELPNKFKLLSFLEKENADNIINQYFTVLKNSMKDENVIVLSAIGTRKSISLESLNTKWLKWQSEVIGMDLSCAKIIALIENNGKVTSAFIYTNDNNILKGFILMMGGNNMPGNGALDRIVGIFIGD
ncbi:MAG TPA: hypothetical protein PLZ43_15290 [bacterium]|nr:hypothetical protein [bacterium]